MYKSRISAAIELSPLLRQTEFNLAEDIIRTGLETGNISDYHQQVLGIPSVTSANALTIDHIRASLAANKTLNSRHQVRLAGIDQGRGQHWLYIAEFHLPDNYINLPTQITIENTIQKVLYGGDCLVTEIPKLLDEYCVEFGLIDNEPEISESAELARQTNLQLADQKANQLSLTKKIQVSSGGIKHNCWGINNESFLKAVLLSFLNTDSNSEPLHRIPDSWDKWLNNPSELSPIRHLLAPKYDPESNKWIRGEGNIDDLYYACMFMQAAFYIWLTEIKPKSGYQPGLGLTR